MPKYESQVKAVPQATASQVYQALSNLETFRPILENAPDNAILSQKLEEAGQDPSQLEKLRDVQLTNDTLTVPAPMIGSLTLKIIDREADRCVKMQTVGSPVEATLWVQMLPVAAGGSKLRVTLSADLNMMMKMMLGKKLAKGVDQFADMLAQLPYQMMPQP